MQDDKNITTKFNRTAAPVPALMLLQSADLEC